MRTAAHQKKESEALAVSAALVSQESREAGPQGLYQGVAHNFGDIDVQLPQHEARIQPKLKINQPGDVYEREADAMADQVMRSADGAPNRPRITQPARPTLQRKEATNALTPDPSPAVGQTLQSAGQPMDVSTRSFMEQRFGHDFSQVRIHNDPVAHQSSDDIQARAYTHGHHVAFGAGQYQPGSETGQKLLAHELTHVVQQENHQSDTVQRDVKAYYKEKTEALPTFDMTGASSSYQKFSAEAQKLHDALTGLIATGKITEIKSKSGDVAWFAANHQKNVQLSEIEAALQAAGIPNALALAKRIDDIHAEYVYSQESLISIAPFYSHETKSKSDLHRNNSRELTEYEIRQAKRVFKSSLDYAKVTIEERSKVFSVKGYARTVGNSIYFPDEIRDMDLLIHELTHVWQYQTTGWTYAPKALIAQAFGDGYSYTDEGKTKEQTLIDARAAGKVLTSFNKEQQGDILADYFSLLRSGKDVSAYQPFINDI